MTAGQGWFKEYIFTFTSIQATRWNLAVSLRVLVTAPLQQKITLDITTQSTLYTDAPREMIRQRSGGLENSKFLYQTRQTPFTNEKHRTLTDTTIVNTTLPSFVFFPYLNFTVTNVTYCTGCRQSCVEIKCTLTRNTGSWILSLFSSSYGHKVTFSQLHGKFPLITKRGKISSDHIRNANKEVELQKGWSVILTISYKVINWEPNHLLSHSWQKQSNRQVLVEHSNKLSEHHRFDFCWEPSASLTSFPSHQRLNTTANHWHLSVSYTHLTLPTKLEV